MFLGSVHEVRYAQELDPVPPKVISPLPHSPSGIVKSLLRNQEVLRAYLTVVALCDSQVYI